jgi:plasmid stabilization system protein ParE
MGEVKEISWTPIAREDLENTVDWLKYNWGAGVAEEFTLRVFKKVELLALFPQMGAE